MFLLLIKIRLLSARNAVADSLKRHRLWSLFATALGLGFFTLAFLGVLIMFNFADRSNVASVRAEAVYQIFYFLFLFLLAGAVPFIASTLLQSNDYSLLFSAPVPPRAIVAAKLIDATVTNSLQFAVLGVPAIVAASVEIGLTAFGWLLVPAIIILFTLLPALLTALALLIALHVLGMRRLRAAVTLMNAVMATAICITVVIEAGHLPLKGQNTPTLFWLRPEVAVASPGAHYAPSAFFARALLLLSHGDLGSLAMGAATLGAIGLGVAALFGACMSLGGRLLSAANVAEEDERLGSHAGAVIGVDSAAWRALFSAPVAALIAKDFKYLWRDTVLMSQLTMPLILFVVPFVVAMQDKARQLQGEMFGFASGMTLMIVFMQTSILSLSSIGLESRGFWLVMTSPNAGRTLLFAKFLMSALVTSVIGVALTVFSGTVFGAGTRMIAIQSVIAVFGAAALCGLGVGISASLPRFVYENPAHRVSAWAMILGFIGSIGYVLASSVIFVVAWVLELRPEGVEHAVTINSTCAALFVILSLLTIFVPLAVGSRQIEEYQWEH